MFLLQVVIIALCTNIFFQKYSNIIDIQKCYDPRMYPWLLNLYRKTYVTHFSEMLHHLYRKTTDVSHSQKCCTIYIVKCKRFFVSFLILHIISMLLLNLISHFDLQISSFNQHGCEWDDIYRKILRFLKCRTHLNAISRNKLSGVFDFQ